MKDELDSITFEVQIEGYDNFTWQGKLITEGRVIPFRSDLELLLAVNELLYGDQQTSCPWNDK